MKQKPLFQEKQRFTQWWIWFINIVSLLICFVGIYTRIITEEEPFGKPALDGVLIFSVVFIISLNLFFYLLNLKTRITQDKIYFKFFPFHSKEQEYLISDIKSMEVIKYSPFFDYGGWGIRGFGDNKAFNVKGNKGLKILFKDGTKRLIGTQKPEELQRVIKNLKFETSPPTPLQRRGESSN